MSNEMYLIHGDDYLSHIEDKVHLYSMLKQLNHQIARLPSNHGCKELSMLAAQYDAIAEEMFRSWGIPKSYQASPADACTARTRCARCG